MAVKSAVLGHVFCRRRLAEIPMSGVKTEALSGPLETTVTPTDPPGSSPPTGTHWVDLVERLKTEDQSGMEELYKVFSRGVRFYLCRQLGPQDLEDKVHDTFQIVVQAIRKGELREPERLMGFVRTLVRRQVAAQIDRAVQSRREQAELDTTATVSDRSDTPEQATILRQHE